MSMDLPPLPAAPPSRTALEAVCVVEFVRAGGPGGQHRNKRFTGVRVLHPPTGLVGQATERRSQAQNLEVAWQRLLALLIARAHRPRPRRATRPTRASQTRRLQAKRSRGEIKATRHSLDEG